MTSRCARAAIGQLSPWTVPLAELAANADWLSSLLIEARLSFWVQGSEDLLSLALLRVPI